MTALNRAAILTALMTMAGTLVNAPAEADTGKSRGYQMLEKQQPMFFLNTKTKWRKGDVIGGNKTMVPFSEWAAMRLPAPPRGAFYGYVDQELLLIKASTQQILDTVVSIKKA